MLGVDLQPPQMNIEGYLLVFGGVNSDEHSTQYTGGVNEQTEEWSKSVREDNVLLLTERKAAATKFAGKRFLRMKKKGEKNLLHSQQ